MRQTYAKEAHVKDDIKVILDRWGWFWFMPPANAYGKSGISDIIAVKNGTFLAIEAKFGSNKPTAQQIGFLNSIRSADGFAFVVNEKTLPWLDAFLEDFDASTIAQTKGEKITEEQGSRMMNALNELSNKLLDTAAPEATAIEVEQEPAGAPN
jgi:hypothetical protein